MLQWLYLLSRGFPGRGLLWWLLQVAVLVLQRLHLLSHGFCCRGACGI